jgi:hypothetical protein
VRSDAAKDMEILRARSRAAAASPTWRQFLQPRHPASMPVISLHVDSFGIGNT